MKRNSYLASDLVEMLLKNGESLVAFGGVIDDGLRIAFVVTTSEVRGLVESFWRNLFEFRNPFFKIFSLGIETFGLCPRILDSKVRGGIGTSASRPLPATIIGGDLAIEKMLGKVLLAESPIEMKIFG